VGAYRWATPAPMTNTGTVRLLATLIAGAAAFALRARLKNKHKLEMTQHLSFLLGGFVFALIMMQGALVRSDDGHVVIACFAMVLLTGIVLFSFDSQPLASALVVVAVACSFMVSRPVFTPSTVIHLVQEIRRPLTQCPAGFEEFDRGCFRPQFTGMLQSASNFLGRHSAASDAIVIFPYQTKFGIAARRNVAGGLMQAYTASGPRLAQLEVGGLEEQPAPVGLYLPDADMVRLSEGDLMAWRNLDLSLPVGGVYNFTRTSEVWFWMLQHYRTSGQLSPGVFGLLHDDSRASRISFQAQTLALATRTYSLRERSSIVDIGVPDWPPGADFLRLRLKVRYGFWWKLRKPERLQLEISRADGSSELRWFIIQPNMAMDVWLYPWGAPDLVRYLEADEVQWRSRPRPSITGLRILATPMDWVSVAPESITVEAADAVTLSMRP
jgi:hypothetical protein